jgi:hypothetical protein
MVGMFMVLMIPGRINHCKSCIFFSASAMVTHNDRI